MPAAEFLRKATYLQNDENKKTRFGALWAEELGLRLGGVLVGKYCETTQAKKL